MNAAFGFNISVDRMLSEAFATLASMGMSGSSYERPTSASTVTNKLSAHDRHAMAVWTEQTAKAALSAPQWAHVVATHDGHSNAKGEALDTLASHFGNAHRSTDLVRAVIEREFCLGETWCPSFRDIGHRLGVSHVLAARVALRIATPLKALGKETAAILQAAFEAKGYLRSSQALH